MQCTNGRIAPSTTTKYRLFADSGGFCQKPDCLMGLFLDFDADAIHIAEIAHVICASDTGPRPNANLGPEERASYENLILLCPKCHTIIDKIDAQFPEATVKEWKRNHKERIASQFGVISFQDRAAAREALLPMLEENMEIFQTYGPLTTEQHNPESSTPPIWIRKIRAKIIPNNRKLLLLCDANRKLLTDIERTTVGRFRQHIDDFEAKHIHGSESNGISFPREVSHLFAERISPQ